MVSLKTVVLTTIKRGGGANGGVGRRGGMGRGRVGRRGGMGRRGMVTFREQLQTFFYY